MKVVAKIIATLFLSAIFLAALGASVKKIGDPNNAIRRYRDTPVAPRVHIRAIAHRLPDHSERPLCVVERQRWGSCGKYSCWRHVSSILSVTGTLEPTTPTTPVPSSLSPSASWRAEPPLGNEEVVTPDRQEKWQIRAKKTGIDFYSLGSDRLVERCVEDGDTIYAVGCVENENLVPCAGDENWTFVPSDSPRPAIIEATNDIATKLATAIALLFFVPIMWVPKRGVLVEALAQRAGKPLRALKWSYALLLVLPLGLLLNFLFKAKYGGFVFFAFVLLGWILLAANLLLRRRRVAEALAPVLATERSPLASASGTAELVVRAKMTPPGVPPLLGPDPVAYSLSRVMDVYQNGKNLKTDLILTIAPLTKLEVADESGEGILDLTNAVLDIPALTVPYTVKPPRLLERGFELEPHARHVRYDIEERVIKDGDSLYVLGDVTDIAHRADGGGGYRSVQGSPTLGGQGLPPLLVFKGDERGLVDSLRREARGDYVLAIAASCFVGLAGSIAVFLLVQ